MRQMRRVALAACAAAAMIVPTAGMAQGGPDSSTYLGGTVGQSHAKDFCTDVSGAGTTCDDKYTSWSILVGYTVEPEPRLRDRLSRPWAGPCQRARRQRDERGESLRAGGAGDPAGRRKVLGLRQVRRVLRRVRYRQRTSSGWTQSDHDSNIDLTYGVGVQFELTKQFGLRAEWQRYQDIGSANIDVDAISIGLIWRFR